MVQTQADHQAKVRPIILGLMRGPRERHGPMVIGERPGRLVPVARPLVVRTMIGKKVHDEVQVNAPRGILTLKITKVS